ncbi:MAG: hypothetical protein HY720_28195 [Planctomycetes bacterium]|nr:hypothetical protein [Planctomycetota bacterium]
MREGKEPSEAVALLVEAESLSALEVEILLGRVARDPVPSTASILDSGVDDGRARVRALFLASLTSVAPERGLVRAAALAWSDPDPSLRRLGLRSLGRLATPEAMGVLAEIARAEFDPEMAELARRILALAQEESSAPAGR